MHVNRTGMRESYQGGYGRCADAIDGVPVRACPVEQVFAGASGYMRSTKSFRRSPGINSFNDSLRTRSCDRVILMPVAEPARQMITLSVPEASRIGRLQIGLGRTASQWIRQPGAPVRRVGYDAARAGRVLHSALVDTGSCFHVRAVRAQQRAAGIGPFPCRGNTSWFRHEETQRVQCTPTTTRSNR